MPVLSKRNSVIVIGLLVILAVTIGASRKKQVTPSLEIEVSEDDLNVLSDSLEDLEFDDLEGLSDEEYFVITESNFDSLEDELNNLYFEDLGGLSDN
jgi:hypothetical protein